MAYEKQKQAEYFKRWRSGEGREKFVAGKKRYRESIRQMVREIKESSSCIICNESHPAVICFHHKDPSSKSFNIGDLKILSMGKQKILKEIAKCDTLCMNCHAKFHWNENNV